jgi:hypothetical protein
LPVEFEAVLAGILGQIEHWLMLFEQTLERLAHE